MKRCVFVPLWSPPEGVFAGGFYRARRMLEHWSDVIVVVGRNRAFRLERRAWITERVFSAPMYATRPGLFEIARLLNWIWSAVALSVIGLTARVKFDAVYVPTSEILPCALAGWIVAKTRKIPLIYCNLNIRDVPLWKVNRALHRRCDAIITLSGALRDELVGDGMTVPILLGSVGVDDESVVRREPTYDGVYIGRMTEAKGIFDLIEIWQRVVVSRHNAKLALMGFVTDSMRAEIVRRLDAVALSSNVSVLGTGSDAEKWALYATARCCVFASHVEGWGIVPIEAALAGLPTVAYDLPAYAETIRGRRDFELIPLYDVDAFARAVLVVLDRVTVESASRVWATSFSWSEVADTERRLVESVIAKGR